MSPSLQSVDTVGPAPVNFEGVHQITQRDYIIEASTWINHFNPNLTEKYLTGEQRENIDRLIYTVTSKSAKFLRQTKAQILQHKKDGDIAFKNAKIDEFLMKHIQTYHSQSKKGKQNLINSFEMQEFCAGVTLIKEGLPNKNAFIIMSGECKLVKKTNPASLTNGASPGKLNRQIPQKQDVDIFKKGLDAREA